MVTEREITTTTTTTIEEKYKVNAPESMQETFMSDSEDEGGQFCCSPISKVIKVLLLFFFERYLSLLYFCFIALLSLSNEHN